MKKKPEPRTEPLMTTGQKMLAERHGTPAEFARAVYASVPSDISMDEARVAVEKYNREWEAARRIL